MLKAAALYALATLSFLMAGATHEKVISDARGNALPGDSILMVRDSSFAAAPASIEQTYLSQNIVTVYLDEASTLYIQSPFTAKVYVSYTLKDYAGNIGAAVTDSFTVRYDTTGTPVLRDYRVFTAIQESKVKVTGIVSNVGWDVRPLIGVSNEIAVSRSYRWLSCPTLVDTVFNAAIPGQGGPATATS